MQTKSIRSALLGAAVASFLFGMAPWHENRLIPAAPIAAGNNADLGSGTLVNAPGVNFRIRLAREGTYSWLSPAIPGVTGNRVHSVGVGQSFDGGYARIDKWVMDWIDTPDGLVLKVTFEVSHLSGNPYLVIPRAGVMVDGVRA